MMVGREACITMILSLVMVQVWKGTSFFLPSHISSRTSYSSSSSSSSSSTSTSKSTEVSTSYSTVISTTATVASTASKTRLSLFEGLKNLVSTKDTTAQLTEVTKQTILPICLSILYMSMST